MGGCGAFVVDYLMDYFPLIRYAHKGGGNKRKIKNIRGVVVVWIGGGVADFVNPYGVRRGRIMSNKNIYGVVYGVNTFFIYFIVIQCGLWL